MSWRGILLVAFLTGLTLFGYVRSRFLVVEMSYKATAQQALQEKLEQDRRKLTVELATLQDPQRIERIAKNKLGLSAIRAKLSKIIVKEEDL